MLKALSTTTFDVDMKWCGEYVHTMYVTQVMVGGNFAGDDFILYKLC